MNWTDGLINELLERMNDPEYNTYPKLAEYASGRLQQPIHPEQLRGALRRARAQERLDVVRSEAAQPRRLEAASPVSPRPASTSYPPTRIRFAAIGDTHLGSKYHLPGALNAFYDIVQREGIRDVYHTGNYVDGEARFNVDDIHVFGMDNQLRYMVETYPMRDGVTTHYISGDDHEGWWRGVNVGERLQDIATRAGRNDLQYLGYMESDVVWTLPDGNPFVVRVQHPGKGSAYAVSFTSQKIVDSWAYEDGDTKPDILLIGHYHKAEYLPNYRGTHVIQTGAFQSITPFMRKQRLRADIGGWIVDVSFESDAVRVKTEFIHFPTAKWKHR